MNRLLLHPDRQPLLFILFSLFIFASYVFSPFVREKRMTSTQASIEATFLRIRFQIDTVYSHDFAELTRIRRRF